MYAGGVRQIVRAGEIRELLRPGVATVAANGNEKELSRCRAHLVKPQATAAIRNPVFPAGRHGLAARNPFTATVTLGQW